MSNRMPWFPFYPADWLDFRCQRLTLESQGAYMKVLCFMWRDSADGCSIPYDVAAIARALGVSARRADSIINEMLRSDVAVLVVDNSGKRLVSKRLRSEAAKAKAKSASASERGKKGADLRWNSNSHATAIAKPMANDSELELQLQSHPDTRSCPSPEPDETEGDGMAAVAYFESGIGRRSTASERRSVRSLVAVYGHDAVCAALGQVKMQHEPDNFRLARHILKAGG